MTRGLRLAAVLAVCAVLAYAAYRVVRHARQPVIPAVVTRNMDVHRAVSLDLDARLDRFLHDRPPVDRSQSPRLIALTFDDGPYPVETPLLLDILADLNVKATFFLIGRDAEEFPDLTRRIASAGHEIGNHTLTHPNLDQLDAAGVRSELADGRAALERYARPSASSLRTPASSGYSQIGMRESGGAISCPGIARTLRSRADQGSPAAILRDIEEQQRFRRISSSSNVNAMVRRDDHRRGKRSAEGSSGTAICCAQRTAQINRCCVPDDHATGAAWAASGQLRQMIARWRWAGKSGVAVARRSVRSELAVWLTSGVTSEHLET